MPPLAPIPEAIAAIAAGRMVILVDDEDRENEGDLVIAAAHATPESIAFMAEHGRGLICLALAPDLVDRLAVPAMANDNQARLGTAFTLSLDAANLDAPGATARSRSRTIQRTLDPAATPADFTTPGHVFPLRARPGGVLQRSGQTEGSVDLARLAGLQAAAVICEVMADDGTMARLPQLQAFGARYGIPVASVADLIEHRLQSEPLVERVAQSRLATDFGPFELAIYRSLVDGSTHAALVCGDTSGDAPVLVRVHRANLLSDAFAFVLSQGRRNLALALQLIAAEGRGVLLYLDVDRDADELAHSLQGYVQREAGRAWPSADATTKPMDFMEFGTGAQILRDLGLTRLKVMTNQPRRLRAVSGFGLEIVQWIPVGDDVTHRVTAGAA
ncbi:MAG: 3,4-dihydroxy-2-butanone-4-phosphate synthase [Myxococcales bacterium]|nr:3,4-dihydroxy-2-butanone-4-phosphate synthase [Myxococcales bacterium]